MLRQNRYPPPKSLLFRGLHPVFVVYSIVFMSIHYLMRLITQLRANIPLCAAKQMQIESRTCQACLSNYAEMQPFLCKSTHFLSYKHQNHQKIIQYSDNLTITHTIPHYFRCKTKERCKITSNPPNRTKNHWDRYHWFATN